MPRSRVETWIQALGRTWTTENVLAGYATVALASILDPSGGLFSDAARPGQCLCLLFYSSAGASSRRALKAEMRARTNDEIM